MYQIILQIPGLPKMPNQLLHSHWTASHNNSKKWKNAVIAAVATDWPESPLESAEITCIRMSSVEPDYDGLAGSFKPIIDGLVQAGVLKDDNPSILRHSCYKWEKTKPKQGKVRVIVREISKDKENRK